MEITKEYLEEILEEEINSYQQSGRLDEKQKAFIGGRVDILEDLISECEEKEEDEGDEAPNYYAEVVSNLGEIGYDFYSPKGPEGAKEDAKKQFEQEYKGSTVINVRQPVMFF